MTLARSLRDLRQWTRGKEMEMIENCQDKADLSGVCRCHIITYDKKSEVQWGHRARPKLQKPRLIWTGRPSSTGESESCSSWRWCHKVGGPSGAGLGGQPGPDAQHPGQRGSHDP